MYLRQSAQKVQQVRKTSDCICKDKSKAPGTIPASWSLSGAQREFIESMFDVKQVK